MGHLKSFINGVRLPTVFFRDEGQPAAVILYHRGSFVGRAAIHDNVLDVWIILAQNALNGGANEVSLIE